MRKSIILPFLIVAIGQGVFGQSKNQYHVQVRYENGGYLIAYTNDNWKTNRHIRTSNPERTPFDWSDDIFLSEQDAAKEAKKYSTWQLAESHNRTEYQNILKRKKSRNIY